jgi:hypothetical protein
LLRKPHHDLWRHRLQERGGKASGHLFRGEGRGSAVEECEDPSQSLADGGDRYLHGRWSTAVLRSTDRWSTGGKLSDHHGHEQADSELRHGVLLGKCRRAIAPWHEESSAQAG